MPFLSAALAMVFCHRNINATKTTYIQVHAFMYEAQKLASRSGSGHICFEIGPLKEPEHHQ